MRKQLRRERLRQVDLPADDGDGGELLRQTWLSSNDDDRDLLRVHAVSSAMRGWHIAIVAGVFLASPALADERTVARASFFAFAPPDVLRSAVCSVNVTTMPRNAPGRPLDIYLDGQRSTFFYGRHHVVRVSASVAPAAAGVRITW